MQKIVERPVYKSACVDADGMQQINDLIKAGNTSYLIQPCPNLNEIEGTTGKDLMIWSVDTVAKYNDCKARHGAIVKALE